MKVRIMIATLIIGTLMMGITGALKADFRREAVPEKTISTMKSVSGPEEMIRFHVIANSDSEEDQALKRAVRNAILEETAPILAASQSIEESRELVKKLCPTMKAVASKEIAAWNKDYTVHTVFGKCSFPTKSYGTLVLPAGQYEALKVVIGEGEGANWWCVLFPALCFVDIEHSTAVQVDGKDQTNYAIKSKPKIRFFLWEKVKTIFC